MESAAIMNETGPYGSQIVLQTRPDDRLVQYQLELITRHRPPWLLPCALRFRGGQHEVCLNTTDLVPLDLSFTETELCPENGRKILAELIGHLKMSADLLLPADQFSLDPSRIYMRTAPDGYKSLMLAFWPVIRKGQATSEIDRLLSMISTSFRLVDTPADTVRKLLISGGFQELEIVLDTGAEDIKSKQVEANIKPAKGFQPVTERIQLWLSLQKGEIFNKARASVGKGIATIHSWLRSQSEEALAPTDNQTVLLTANPADFRMAMLSEGKPGTPEENEGVRAYILIDEFLIGRDIKSCDLCLTEPGIGRQHARISRRSGSFFICDLGSRNGSRLDGHRLPKNVETLLPDQCLVQFADKSFYFQAD